MPAAGMRRTTRVFGVVQGGDEARVLRSGRRLWPDNHFNLRKRSHENECLKTVHEAPRARVGPGAQQDERLVSNGVNSGPFETDENFDDPVSRESDANHGGAGKMFGIVYSRKRKRFQGSINVGPSDRMFGSYYVKRRKKERFINCLAPSENDDIQPRMLAITFKGSRRNLHLLATFLSSVLTYMRNTSMGLRAITDFLSSQPIAMIFSTAGISLSLECCMDESQCCKIYYSTDMRLLFSVNFSSLPLCFMYMHSTMLLEAERSSRHYLICPKATYKNAEMLEDIKENLLLDPCVVEAPVSELMSTFESPLISLVSTGGHREVMHPKLLPRSASRTLRKKRTSRRSKKAQNFSLFFFQRSNRGRSIPDLFTVSNRAARPFMFANQFHRKPLCINPDVNKKELKSTKSGSREDAALTSCSATVLVIEADKCYREEGAHIILEQYPTKEWFLVVKRNGLIRCCHKAEKVMRPHSSNHVTHDTIWTVADSLKLEFPNKSDWEVFKELYKECAARNRAASTVKFIPVPRVIEVPSYGDEHSEPFSRPEAYIRQIRDEVSHALTRRNSNYDMDSEDEEWLNKFNNFPHRENSTVEHVTDETFELIIDSLEKASYFVPVDFESGEVPANLCSDLCSREVLEAVHSYWINKRKKKQAVLVRVFQVHQPLKDPYDQDNFQRKRKQTKRSAGHSTKAKQQRTEAASTKCIATKNAAEELDVMVKVETADALAKRSLDLAVKKRSIAQILMVNADLLMYKAKMSMKIAEHAQNTESPELADSTDFLNEGSQVHHSPPAN